LLIGVPAALAAAGVMRGLLFHVQPRDPLTFVALPAIIAVTTVAATVAPARRAQRVQPAAVLNRE
jgi:ABC-type lipoprotein release transport system permease subunit